MIDNMTVAVRVYKTDGLDVQSQIKFGSYDPANIAGGEEMSMLRTASRKTWDLKLAYLKMGLGQKGFPGNAFVRFDPGVPYVYLDDKLYETFRAELNSMNVGFSGDVCHSGVNICKFPVSCAQAASYTRELRFQIQDSDAQTYDLTMDIRDTYVDGTKFGDKENTCYFGVFNHGRMESNENGPMSSVIIGNSILHQYYIVYDASTLDSGYLQVGVAKSNYDDGMRGVKGNYGPGKTAAEGDTSVTS